MNEKYIGIAVSVVLHLVLLIIALFVFFEVIPQEIIRQIEIVDFRVERQPSGTRQEIRPVRQIGEPALRDFNTGSMDSQVPLRVDLPQATFLDNDPLTRVDTPLDRTAAASLTEMDDNIGNTFMNLHSPVAQDARTARENRILEQPLSVIDDDYITRLHSMLDGSNDSSSPYILEGEVLQRKIINKVIPDYPQGMQRNAIITIQFNVRPDGYVQDIVIIRRDDPVFEQTSINSLLEWQFNSIPEDKLQKGTITFIYELE